MDGPRLVRRVEIAHLSGLLCAIFGFDQYYDKAEFTRALARPVHLRGGTIVAEHGRPVSYILHVVAEVSVHGCRLKVASIGGVCTDPAYRKRGYAGRVLEQTLQRATAAGARVLIVSGDRSLYRRNHCVPAGELLATTITREALPQIDTGLAVRRFTISDWPALSPLNAAEPVHFVRSADFFAKCCFWWDISQPEIWVVSKAGRPLAYLSLFPPWRDEKRASRFVGDYAGSRAAILDALPLIFQASEVAEIHFRFLKQDRELSYLMASRGFKVGQATLSGTHRILNLPGLMRDLRPYLAGRLPRRQLRQLSFDQQGETCVFSLASQQAAVGLSQAASLILGGPRVPRIGGELGDVLRSVFPVPFPMPGFNYV